MSHLTVVLDACVLYPAQLRSLLMYLAVGDLFRAKWSHDIHAEWMRNVARDHPDLTDGQIERVRNLMDAQVRDCLVTGYEPLIPSLSLPDPDDRHVLAAAIHSGAEVIVTYNLRDFPEAVIGPLDIEAQHPDDFISLFFEFAPEASCEAARRQRLSLKNPTKTVDDYLEILQRQSLTKTVAALRQYLSVI